jgi:uncharacterized membrane protein (DUF2068 family)
MRPLGVTVIAILTWLRGALFAFIGLAILGIGHLSARLMGAVASDAWAQSLVLRLGKVLGVCVLAVAAVYIIVGLGLWGLRNWARIVTLIFVALWFLLGLSGLMLHPGSWHLIRSAIDLVIFVYLMMPDVKRLFVPA